MRVPSRAALEWVRAAAGPGARVGAIVSLSQSGEWGPWRVELDVSGSVSYAVLKLAPAAQAARPFATEAAALVAAEEHDVPAPRLLAAELHGGVDDLMALLGTALPGSTRILEHPDPRRLRVFGAVAASIHTADVRPTAALPPRRQSLEGAGFDDEGSADLAAARRLLEGETPVEPHGLVHGDLWQGNMLWHDGACAGAVDWDFAGVGPAGVDLGSLRCDVAVMYGGDAPDLVLEGWEEAHGGPAENLAYWDVVAGASTPADLSGWLPNFHAQGREDLTIDVVTRRRDVFLADALRRLP